MKKIDVKVSENASIAEIAGRIAKTLSKHKQLQDKQNDLKRIGTGDIVEVIDNAIQINVTRDVGKHDELVKCHCGQEYMKSAGVSYKANYGGVTRRRTVCSVECFTDVERVCGTGRVARTNNRLVNVVKVPDYIGETPIAIKTDSKNSITVKKDKGAVFFYKNGLMYEPTIEELKIIHIILKLTK